MNYTNLKNNGGTVTYAQDGSGNASITAPNGGSVSHPLNANLDGTKVDIDGNATITPGSACVELVSSNGTVVQQGTWVTAAQSQAGVQPVLQTTIPDNGKGPLNTHSNSYQAVLVWGSGSSGTFSGVDTARVPQDNSTITGQILNNPGILNNGQGSQASQPTTQEGFAGQPVAGNSNGVQGFSLNGKASQ